MDPCDLTEGGAALRDLVARRTPLFEFAIRAAIAEMDLGSAEEQGGRAAPLRTDGGPDQKTPRCVTSQLAGWVAGRRRTDHRVRGEAKRTKTFELGGRIDGHRPGSAATAGPRPDSRSDLIRVTRPCGHSVRHSTALQYPALAGPVFER